MKKNDGGYVYPFNGKGGITLRDYFAAAALTGFCTQISSEYTNDWRVKKAYVLADAMLKERENENS